MPMFRDYSENTDNMHPSIFHSIYKLFFLKDIANYEKTSLTFKTSNWFAKKMTDYVNFLDYAIEGNEASTMNALIYAYSYPGTTEAIIRLCQGIFGKDAIIVLETQPAVVTLTITNANIRFFFGLASKQEAPNLGIVKPPEGLVVQDFKEIAGSSVTTLIERFLPAGWVLNLTIN